MSFSAVILAGGKSSRMGRDKAFLETDGQTLLARQVEIVQDAGAAEIFISGRSDTDYSLFNCRVLLDEFSNVGPLAGIHAALAAVKHAQLLVLAVDLPNMTPRLLRQIIDSTNGFCGVIPRVNGNVEPLAAIYPKSALSLCLQLLGERRNAVNIFAGQCVDSALASFIDLPAGNNIFFANCNSPVDFQTHLTH